ncbi:MAG TPA: carboxymuconolactone decarboxylase family protein [Casimicrobiaceae bacterium]
MTKDYRIPPVAPGTRAELADIEREIVAQRGRVSPLYQVLLNSAPLAGGWEKLLTAVRNRSTVPAHLRELIILRVAVLNGALFEFSEHLPPARKAGLSEAKIQATRTWNLSGAAASESADLTYDDDEKLVLALADAMTRDIVVPDAIMQRLAARFDARGVLETVATVAAYNMVSRLLVALNVEH